MDMACSAGLRERGLQVPTLWWHFGMLSTGCSNAGNEELVAFSIPRCAGWLHFPCGHIGTEKRHSPEHLVLRPSSITTPTLGNGDGGVFSLTTEVFNSAPSTSNVTPCAIVSPFRNAGCSSLRRGLWLGFKPAARSELALGCTAAPLLNQPGQRCHLPMSRPHPRAPADCSAQLLPGSFLTLPSFGCGRTEAARWEAHSKQRCLVFASPGGKELKSACNPPE